MKNTSRSFLPGSLFIIFGSIALLVFAAVDTDGFVQLTKQKPYIMGFVKLFFLGTLGEILKSAFRRRTLKLDKLFARACVWGLFGLWFTPTFPLFAAGTAAIISSGLWFTGAQAFSMSLWINILGGYAMFMMVTHEYANYVIDQNGRKWNLTDWSRTIDRKFVFSFLPKTLVFWVPAHTITFMLPPEWRVLSAALLAIVLGVILGVTRNAPETR